MLELPTSEYEKSECWYAAINLSMSDFPGLDIKNIELNLLEDLDKPNFEARV